ncbi:MAG: class I SAM-dependent methyltransferase [Spirochaetia bacterium]|nr:class I SAM-dependent methyltransferase [Spirochaetia bacterium]
MIYTKEELEAHNRVYLARQEMYSGYGYDNAAERRFIIKQAGHISGSVLEAGTGKGYLTLELAREYFSITSYDVDPKIQEEAKKNLAFYGLLDHVRFMIEKKDKLSFKDGCFDAVFCVNTLHHLANSAAVLDELTRVTATYGKFILSDFTEKTFRIMDLVHAADGGKHEVIGWTMDKTAGYLKNKGFKIKENGDDYQRVFIIGR